MNETANRPCCRFEAHLGERAVKRQFNVSRDKLFLDTDGVLDHLADRQPFAEYAHRLLALALLHPMPLTALVRSLDQMSAGGRGFPGCRASRSGVVCAA